MKNIDINEVIKRIPFSSNIYKFCDSLEYEDVCCNRYIVKNRGLNCKEVVLDKKERDDYYRLFQNKDFKYIENKIFEDFYGKRLIVKEGFLNKQ